MTEKWLNKSRFKQMQQNMFSSPEFFLLLYEYACNKNYWYIDDEKMK